MLAQQETTAQATQAGENAQTVGELRSGIDQVDAEIRALFERRRELSHAVQRARMAEGGSRTDTGREMKVIKGYADGFGRQGTTISLALLEICRGVSPSATN
ncbi:chorismate mutase [Streptomyces sp. NBC_01142]|uniref:chorismate mutase n=1 Tax=Streptomyces sp. NBC_01142 TaxID=2975865 RepID=UPI0022583370|nr:chorismate mutase [Streptomyces sp. NBC_01142]MCX4819033.1 chorismate mutase [Streptomyces sp. NBC_01142]